jgi:hypothetical protein
MSDFLLRQARKERKERQYYTRVLGIRRERPAPYRRESPRRSTPTGQVQTTDQSSAIDVTSATLGEAGASDAPQGQAEISEIPNVGRSSPQKRRREDDDDGTFN